MDFMLASKQALSQKDRISPKEENMANFGVQLEIWGRFRRNELVSRMYMKQNRFKVSNVQK